jgi:hypothetical protein
MLYEECMENVLNFELYSQEVNFQTSLITFSILG